VECVHNHPFFTEAKLAKSWPNHYALHYKEQNHIFLYRLFVNGIGQKYDVKNGIILENSYPFLTEAKLAKSRPNHYVLYQKGRNHIFLYRLFVNGIG